MRLAELAGRRVALLGAGADVVAALPSVVAAGPAALRLVPSDDAVPGPASLERAGVEPVGVEIAGVEVSVTDLDRAAGWAEVFVRSPGFPRYLDPLTAALARGATMTTPVDLWMGSVGPGRTVVGVTGTKGKSTVSTLVGRMAADHGLDVGVAGNLGPPVFGTGWNSSAPIVVLEISSYQAADLNHVPDIAAVTFLAEDHVSWHGGVEQYVADKLRVVRNPGGTAGQVLVAEAAGQATERLALMGVEVHEIRAPRSTDPELPGHRVRNAALAGAVVQRLTGHELSDQEVLAAAASSLPGRLDRCPGPAGVLCVDDALASNPTATAAALDWMRGLDRPTVLLVGGSDRGVDSGPLRLAASKWSPGTLRAVALPDSGVELAESCGLDLVGRVASVAEAVPLALEACGPAGAVLFSPAAATPAVVGNWQDRSAQFRVALLAAGT